MFLEEGMNRFTQDAFPLTMNYPYFINLLFVAGVEIFVYHGGGVFGGEHMQVENPIDGIFNFIYIIHNKSLQILSRST